MGEIGMDLVLSIERIASEAFKVGGGCIKSCLL
jgi:hypothetical protein